jgi:protein-S-isoprenylcysteine O-methyltransferase Ste14
MECKLLQGRRLTKDTIMSDPEVEPNVPQESTALTQAPAADITPPPPSLPAVRTFSRLDLLELLIVLVFYAFFYWKFVPPLVASWNALHDISDIRIWSNLLVIASETVTVLFLLVRRRAQTFSTSLGDWLLALGTTVTPALIFPGYQPFSPAFGPLSFFVCLTRGAITLPMLPGMVLATVGLTARIACTVYLGRSFGVVAANRGVKQSGPYRLVRHPIYAAYLINHVGVFWLNPSLWNIFVYFFCWGLMIRRIEAEESHLSKDPAYVEYQKTVRYRLIPWVY